MRTKLRTVQLRAFDAARQGNSLGLPVLLALCSGLLRTSLQGGLIAVGGVSGLSAIQMGQLDADGARLVSLVLASLLLGIAGYYTFFLLTRASYALEDPVTPTVVNLGVTAGTITGLWAATQVWEGTGLLVAFGLITSVLSVSGSVVLHRVLVRRSGHPIPAMATIVRTTAAAAAVRGNRRSASAAASAARRHGTATRPTP